MRHAGKFGISLLLLPMMLLLTDRGAFSQTARSSRPQVSSSVSPSQTMVREAQLAATVPGALQTTTSTSSINLLNPSSAQARNSSGSAVPLTVSGTGLSSTASVYWTAPNGFTTFIPAFNVQTAQVSATIPTALLSTPGTASVAVSDPNGVLSNSLPFTINGPAPLLVSPSTLPNGTVGTSYSQLLPATGGSPAYTWSIVGGALPPRLGLSSAGTISGTPTTPGTSTFSARATDTTGAFQSAAFTITAIPEPLTLNSLMLSNAIAGSAYPVQVFGASGGVAPYVSFLLTSGSLPPGLTLLNGQLSGTPTTAGTSSFTITVTDSAGTTASGNFTLVVSPSRADLVLSQGSEFFTLATGSSGVPPGTSVTLRSSQISQILNYSAALASAAPWLDVNAGGLTTPGSVGISLDPSATSLAAGNYQATINVTCVAPSPCAGNAQTISVSLAVSPVSPELAVSTDLLSFLANGTTGQTSSLPLGLQNVGGGTITVNSVTAAPYISVTGVPATLKPGPAVPLTVTVNPAGLAPGYYPSTIAIATSAGSVQVAVGLLVYPAPFVTLNPGGSLFSALAGTGPGNLNGSFLVTTNVGSASWTAAELPGASWLILKTSSGTSTVASPGTVSFSVDPLQVSLLNVGTYYGGILVSAPGTVDPVQSYRVVLNVTSTATGSPIDPEPGGLVFFSSSFGAVPSQAVQVFASSATPIGYQASSNSPWLSVSPSTGSTSSASAAETTVSVNPAGLQPGIYRGNVSYALSSANSRGVAVTLIVQLGPNSPASVSHTRPLTTSGTCTPTQLVPTQTGPTNNFSQPTSWPTPMTMRLFNDCSVPVTNGQIVATFSNGDPPIVLSAVDSTSGTYSGTWTPHGTAAQMSISAQATAPGFPAATLLIQGQITPNPAPVLSPNGALNVFGAPPGAPLAPGMIAQIYGSNMAAPSTSQTFTNIPLTTSLANTSVLIGGVPAPLYYVSPGQINAQVPFNLAPGSYQIIVNANGALSTPSPVQVSTDQPGIAAFSNGQVITEHANFNLVSDAAPAAPGEYVTLYLAGMGLTVDTVASGQPSPATPLPTASDQPILSLNGQSIPIYYAGLSPTYVGLYQVTFQVPANTPNGDLQLTVTQTGGASNAVILPVHN